jgi:hypothetical protein
MSGVHRKGGRIRGCGKFELHFFWELIPEDILEFCIYPQLVSGFWQEREVDP